VVFLGSVRDEQNDVLLAAHGFGAIRPSAGAIRTVCSVFAVGPDVAVDSILARSAWGSVLAIEPVRAVRATSCLENNRRHKSHCDKNSSTSIFWEHPKTSFFQKVSDNARPSLGADHTGGELRRREEAVKRPRSVRIDAEKVLRRGRPHVQPWLASKTSKHRRQTIPPPTANTGTPNTASPPNGTGGNYSRMSDASFCCRKLSTLGSKRRSYPCQLGNETGRGGRLGGGTGE
jgi:hypothetical protein